MIIEKFNFIDGTAILMIQLRLGESDISCLKARMADSGCLCSVDTDLLSLSWSRLLGLNRGRLLSLSWGRLLSLSWGRLLSLSRSRLLSLSRSRLLSLSWG